MTARSASPGSQPLPNLGEVGKVVDQLRDDLRHVATQAGWDRERVLAVGAAIRRAIEAGDAALLASFAREYAWRRRMAGQGKPALQAIDPRQAMPTVAAWIDGVRAVFGDVKVHFAMEAGLVFGTRPLPTEVVSGEHLALRNPDEEAALMKRLKRR